MKRKLPEIGEFVGQPGVKRVGRELLLKPDGIEKYVLAGWSPEQPFITKEDRITVFGSCFGRVVKILLKGKGYKMTPTDEAEEKLPLVENGFRFVSAALIRQHFEWAWAGGDMVWDRWVNTAGTGVPPEELRQGTKKAFDATKVFMLTYGLSEVWRNKDGTKIRFGPIETKHFDPEVEEFHISSFQETKTDIQKTVDLIHSNCPDATIIVSLSPIPIQTTFRKISSITANSASKAILRAAIDEVMRENENDEKLWYFPSYEIIYDMPLPDKWAEDGWHPRREYTNEVVGHFAKCFLKDF